MRLSARFQAKLHPKNLFPILGWAARYDRQDLRGDLVAGLTVGVMVIPQGMAYAILAGVPPIYGLYASLIPLLVYPVLGTSRHLAVGIVALDSLILSAGLAGLAEAGTETYIALALALAAMTGLLQVAMGLLRLGFVVNLLSRPVIAGFTAAAALTIGVSQFPGLLGLEVERLPYAYELVWAMLQAFEAIHLPTLAIGLAGIGLLVGVRRFAPRVPGPLLIVVLGIGLVGAFRLDADGVAIVGAIPSGLPKPTLPTLDLATIRTLLPTALTLALVQFMSVISLGKVFAAKHRYTVKPNHELVALGAMNIAGSMFRSVPVSGSFSRSAVAEQSGGRTALVNVVAALLVGLTLAFLTPVFYYLPIAVFAAIIIVSAFGLIDIAELRFLLRAKRTDGAIALLTFASTLVIGIHQGVLIGVAASVVAIMYRISRPNVAELGHLPGTRSFRDVDRYPDAVALEGILILRVDASFWFANATFLHDLILRRSEKETTPIRAVLIDASSINDLDTTAAATLAQVADTLEARGIAFYFGGAKEPILDQMRRTGLYDELGPERFFLSPHRAVLHILQSWDEEAGYLDNVPGEQVTAPEPPGGSMPS